MVLADRMPPPRYKRLHFSANFALGAASFALSRLLGKPVIWGLPTSVMIEPTNRCNLRCPLCPAGAGTLTRPKGDLTAQDFERILDALGSQVREVFLWNQGEPLLNSALPEMIRIAHDRGIRTITSTNGQLLDKEESARQLILARLDTLIISVDGLTPETYEVYRVGGQLQRVVSGMETLRRLRIALRAHHPKIILQWLPMKHNEAELPQLEAKARQWGADCVEIKTTQVYTNEEAEQFLPRDLRLSRYHRQGQRWEVRRRRESCRRLWFSCQIDWDGTVVPCCFDKDEEFVMGNVHQEPLAEIWRGRPYQRLRQSLLTHGRTLDMCLNCTEGLKTFYIFRRRLAGRGNREKGTGIA